MPLSWWPSRKRRRAETPEPPPPTEATYASPSFAALLAALETREKPSLLDLGPAVPENVEFFSKRSCRLTIEDLAQTLLSTDAQGRRGRAKILDFPSDTRFDAVLAWDLFDHLEPAVLERVARSLEPYCPTGCWLFALAGYLAEIPDRPAIFKAESADRLRYCEVSPHRRPGPRFSPRTLENALPGFRLEKSFLLKNGRQEYLFRRV